MSRKVALIVGVGQYHSSTNLTALKAPVNDANALYNLLKQYSDFDLVPLPKGRCDDSRYCVAEKALSTREFEREFTGIFSDNPDTAPDQVLLYFSGHGTTQTRLGKTSSYLAFSDDRYALPLRDLCEAIESSRVSKVVVILDCCHSGAVHDFFGQLQAKKFCLIAASSATGEALAVAGQSLLTQIVLEGLNPEQRQLNEIATDHLVRFINEYPNKPPNYLPPSGSSYDYFCLTQHPSPTSVNTISDAPPIAKRPAEINAYLDNILHDASAFQQGYIDLSATTVQPQQSLAEKANWSRSLIPTSFTVLDNSSNPKHTETKSLNSICDAFDLHHCFVLLGAPGAGKSTSLIKLELEYAAQARQNLDALIPIRINLAEWPDDIHSIPALIHLALQTYGLSPIAVHHLLILLDGLNEVSIQHYVERIKLLEQWLKTNATVAVVISCREKHYQNHKQLKIPSVHIEPFDNHRIQLFLKAHLGTENAQKILPQLGSLQAEQRSARDLIHLANNPFFLAMICYVYAIKKYLPNSRGQLFQLFVKTLYKRENEKQNIQSINQHNFIKALSAIAFAMQKKRSATSMHTLWAEKQIPPHLPTVALWEFAKEAGLIQLLKNERVFQFSHQLILEYFAAEALLKRFKSLSKYIQKPHFSRQKRLSSAWDEVIYTLAGITEPNQLLHKIAETDPFLAIECIEHIPKELEVTPATWQLIIQKLMQCFDSYHEKNRMVAVSKLVEIGTASIAPLTEKLHNSNNPVVKRACLKALAEFTQIEAIEAIAWALLDKGWVRKDAISVVINYDEITIEALLKQLFLSKKQNKRIIELIKRLFENIEITEQLIKCIELYRSEYPDLVAKALSILNNKISNIRKKAITKKILPALYDKDCAVRIATIQALQASGYKELMEKILPALYDKKPSVRTTAIKALRISGYKNLVEKILPALYDEKQSVRIAAVNVLQASGYKGLAKKILPALYDKKSSVRAIAIINALQASSYKELMEKFLLAFLNDERLDVRITFINALQVSGYTDLVGKILPVLNDKSSDVRIAAIKALQASGDTDLVEKILPVLNDKNPSVRIVAMNILRESACQDLAENIISALNDKDFCLRITATSVLFDLRPEIINKKIQATFVREAALSIYYIESYGKIFQITLLYVISQLNDMKLIQQYLIPKLKDNDALLRRTAVLALGKLKNPEFKPYLLASLKDKNPMVQQAAQQMIEAMA